MKIKKLHLTRFLMTTLALSFSLGNQSTARAQSLSVSPTGSFGSVAMTTTKELNFTLKNVGSKSLKISALSLGSTANFSLVSGGSCASGTTMSVGASCTQKVKFTPTAIKSYQTSLITKYSLGTSSTIYSKSVTLSGSGTAAPVVEGKLEWQVVPLFGDVLIGEKKMLSMIFKNTGTEKIRLDEYWFNPNDSEWKVIGGTCQYDETVVAAGASCSVNVEFAASAMGEKVTNLVIGYYPGDRWTWKEVVVPLRANGVSTSIPDPLTSSVQNDFGTVSVGEAKTALVTVKNNGTEQVMLDQFVTSADNGDSSIFRVSGGTCQEGGAVAAGGTCQLQVTFLSANPGTFQGDIEVTYSLGTSQISRELSIPLIANAVLAPNPTPTPTPTPTPVPGTTGALHVEGRLIKNDAGEVVVLKGMNIPDVQHLNTKPQERPGVTAMSIAKMAAETLKSKVVRLPVLPGTSASSPDGWFSTQNGRDKYFTTHLDPIVQYLTQKKVYVIIDLHYLSDYTGKWPAVQEFWTYMAPKYKDNPYVLYEIFNEPIYPDDWNTWKNEIAQPAVNLIRQYAPKNLIIVGGPGWSSHMWGAATNPVAGTNIVYTAHVYPNQTPEKWERNFGALDKVAPLFVTEWGWELYNNPATSTGTTSGFGVPFQQWMNDRGLSWCSWTLDFVWEPRMVDSNWNLKGGDAYMGQYIFDLLKSNDQGGTSPVSVELIKTGESWKYLDNNTQPAGWIQNAFDDATWKSGPSPLGYGDGDEATLVGYGSNSGSKYVTTSFRKKFTLDSFDNYQNFTLYLLKDDGAVVYVNGVEVLRSNMPTGTFTAATLASTAVDGAGEIAYTTFELNKSLFRSGENVVSVEVHQASAGSSDISFDLRLKGTMNP